MHSVYVYGTRVLRVVLKYRDCQLEAQLNKKQEDSAAAKRYGQGRRVRTGKAFAGYLPACSFCLFSSAKQSEATSTATSQCWNRIPCKEGTGHEVRSIGARRTAQPPVSSPDIYRTSEQCPRSLPPPAPRRAAAARGLPRPQQEARPCLMRGRGGERPRLPERSLADAANQSECRTAAPARATQRAPAPPGSMVPAAGGLSTRNGSASTRCTHKGSVGRIALPRDHRKYRTCLLQVNAEHAPRATTEPGRFCLVLDGSTRLGGPKTEKGGAPPPNSRRC